MMTEHLNRTPPARTTRRLVAAMMLIAIAGAAWGSTASGQSSLPLVPEHVPVAEPVEKALEAEWLTDEERAAMRVNHGVWDDRDLISAELEAIAALNARDFSHPSLQDPDVPVEIRAEARLLMGDLEGAIDLLKDVDSVRAARIRAESLEGLGRLDEAEDAVRPAVRELLRRQVEDPDVLTEGVRALFVRARLQGQPARDFNTMLELLARARDDLDRLHWRSRLAEAELLYDKDDLATAVDALHEVLMLNPRSAEAWYLLGRIAVDTFDFRSAERAAERLRVFNPAHPLAELLLAEARLTQDDPEAAVEILDPLIERLPQLRRARALYAAAQAILYDEYALDEALAAYEELSPGSAKAYYVAGKQLSFNRQYEAAAEMLEVAILRQPKWPAPQIELGLMELQSGRDSRALAVLRDVVALDRFNKRAMNSLNLLEELAEYETVETENFIVRYRPGIDEVLVRMMPERLEEIHRVVTERFQFEPDRKTIIEMMPDHQRFAVRITGMPFVHTIAAATGPVIAMEVPREGPRGRHSGPFDWPRVVQHEYTHTVTLAQTRNRIPHWLTEAAAVEMELAPRDYNTAQMLARSLEEGSLFSLEEIKWAFVRPRQPQDRSKAYAQGHWMLEFMNDRFGSSAVIRLFEQYFDGKREEEAIPNALGMSRTEFFEQFLEWAREDVKKWGLAPEPSLRDLTDELRWADPELAVEMAASKQARLDAIARALSERIGRVAEDERRELTAGDWPPLRRPRVEVTEEILTEWLEQYPDHPDLLKLKIRRALQGADVPNASLVTLLKQYAEARPVDPMPHRRLAQIYLDSGNPTQAIPHLEELDAREERTPVYAAQLARLYRNAGDTERALEKATRALHVNPYHAPNREVAAAIAIEAGRLETARMHLEALVKIEPDRPQHERRLEALDQLISSRR